MKVKISVGYLKILESQTQINSCARHQYYFNRFTMSTTVSDCTISHASVDVTPGQTNELLADFSNVMM